MTRFAHFKYIFRFFESNKSFLVYVKSFRLDKMGITTLSHKLLNCLNSFNTLSEKIAHSTVFHHLSHLSVDIQWSGLIKYRENSGVQTKLAQVGSHSLDWVWPQSTVLMELTHLISLYTAHCKNVLHFLLISAHNRKFHWHNWAKCHKPHKVDIISKESF